MERGASPEQARHNVASETDETHPLYKYLRGGSNSGPALIQGTYSQVITARGVDMMNKMKIEDKHMDEDVDLRLESIIGFIFVSGFPGNEIFCKTIPEISSYYNLADATPLIDHHMIIQMLNNGLDNYNVVTTEIELPDNVLQGLSQASAGHSGSDRGSDTTKSKGKGGKKKKKK